jgi:thiamine pyrophosphate-dependent acetolactate synthase large subunit-like protein
MLDRRHIVATLLADRKSLVVVTGLGSSTYDVGAAGDHDRNFYLWGAMGGAAMLGLGVAIAQPDIPVLVVTGDGEMLMGMGSFSTIALQNPPNLTIAVLNNSLFGETGGQPTHTGLVTNLAQVAKACGVPNICEIDTMVGIAALAENIHDLKKGLTVADIKISRDLPPRVMTSRAGAVMAERTRRALGLTIA